MNIHKALTEALQKLKNKRELKNSAYLDAEILLAHTLKKPREYLYGYPEKILSKLQQKKFFSLIKKRLALYPVAYMTGEKEFYGRKFLVTKYVLIPRPETEHLIEEFMKIYPVERYRAKNLKIADIGSGSGCIAVTLKKLYPASEVYALDLSKRAVKILKKNARVHRAYLKIYCGNLLSPLADTRLDAIVANLPYLNKNAIKKYPPALSFEPKSALFSAENGLNHYKRLFLQMKQYKIFPYTLLGEIDPEENYPLQSLVQKLLPEYSLDFQNDLGGKTRVFILKR